MIRLAVLSLLRHRGGAGATACVALVGVILLSAMAGVAATGLAPRTIAGDRPFLVQFPVILGGWVLGIVVFAVVSTVGVALGGRTAEIRGLRLIGATPRQVQRMVAVETFLAALCAAVPGILIGYVLGEAIMRVTAGTGVISGIGGYAPGLLLPGLAGLVVVIAATIGAFACSREPAGRSPVGEPTAATRTRAARPRRITAAVMTGIGLASSTAALAMDPMTVYATAATGPGCVLVAVGLALLAPEVLRVGDVALAGPFRRVGGAAAQLAALNLRAAPERIRPAVTFLTLFVGVSVGTLSMQSIENQAHGTAAGIGQLMAAINYLVVALIAAFMSIALINNLIASIRLRRGELSVMSLLGATAGQSVRMLVYETAVAAVVAATAGTVGAIAAVIPFAVVKTGTASAAVQGVPLVVVIAASTGIALVTAVVVGRNTVRVAHRA